MQYQPYINLKGTISKSDDLVPGILHPHGEVIVHPNKIRRTDSYKEITAIRDRSMLQREWRIITYSEIIKHLLLDAWHVVNTTDPLVDSDEENADEYVRTDYSKVDHISTVLFNETLSVRRLQTLKRLRGKSPTPEAEFTTPLDANENHSLV